jgi:hypothetical protein
MSVPGRRQIESDDIGNRDWRRSLVQNPRENRLVERRQWWDSCRSDAPLPPGLQLCAGRLDRGHEFHRLGIFRKLRRRRKIFERGSENGVGLRVTAGGAIELRQRQRRA